MSEGLEGVIAAHTVLSDVDGLAGRLTIRGYAVEDLAHRAGFEDVAHLLLDGFFDAMPASLAPALGAARVRAFAEVAALDEGLAKRDPVEAVRALIARLPDAALDRVFILFPDPWPKTRHHKRRLITPETLADLARVLKPGGGLRFATDWADYADWTLERVLASGLFAWGAERADDWRVAPGDHIATRYEEKRLGDCAPVFLDFVRL